MGQDGVAIRRANFERTFWQVHVDILAQVALKVFSFVRSLERAQIIGDSRQAQQITMRLTGVFADDDILLEDLAY